MLLLFLQELGEVVTKLDQSCPAALDKKSEGKDELEINIDAIDNRTFHVLDRLIKVGKTSDLIVLRVILRVCL